MARGRLRCACFARDKAVSKYSQLHTNAGRDTVHFATDARYHVVPHDGYRERLTEMLVAAEGISAGQQPRPWVLHTLSMGGLKYATTLLHLAHERRDPRAVAWAQQLAGIVVDSAPGNLSPHSYAMAVAGHLPADTWQYHSNYWRAFAAQTAYSLYDETVNVGQPGPHTRFGLPYLWTHPVCQRLPMLFVYGKGDKVCKSSDTERAIERIRRASRIDPALIQTATFDSPHVAHFRFHPEEYTRAVNDFCALCLDRVNAKAKARVGPPE